jgi:hypothetical protein
MFEFGHEFDIQIGIMSLLNFESVAYVKVMVGIAILLNLIKS